MCLNFYSSLYIHLYNTIYIIYNALYLYSYLNKCMFIFIFCIYIYLAPFGRLKLSMRKLKVRVDLDGSKKRTIIKNVDLITWVWIQVFRQLVFLTFKTTSESLINTELSWEEKVFTAPPLDNLKAAQVVLQWLEGMECWENNSTGNKADWFYLNFYIQLKHTSPVNSDY